MIKPALDQLTTVPASNCFQFLTSQLTSVPTSNNLNQQLFPVLGQLTSVPTSNCPHQQLSTCNCFLGTVPWHLSAKDHSTFKYRGNSPNETFFNQAAKQGSDLCVSKIYYFHKELNINQCETHVCAAGDSTWQWVMYTRKANSWNLMPGSLPQKMISCHTLIHWTILISSANLWYYHTA